MRLLRANILNIFLYNNDLSSILQFVQIIYMYIAAFSVATFSGAVLKKLEKKGFHPGGSGGGGGGTLPYMGSKVVLLAPVVQKLDNAIHRINHYPADTVVAWFVLF